MAELLKKEYFDLEAGFEYSKEVSQEWYDHENYPLHFRPRINCANSIADDACLKGRDDWKAIGKDIKRPGRLNPVSGNLISLWVSRMSPETIYGVS